MQRIHNYIIWNTSKTKMLLITTKASKNEVKRKNERLKQIKQYS